jgi:hypothetical protein
MGGRIPPITGGSAFTFRSLSILCLKWGFPANFLMKKKLLRGIQHDQSKLFLVKFKRANPDAPSTV